MITHQSETLAEALADLYDVVRPNSTASAHFRAAANRERTEMADEVSAIVREWCNEVPELSDNVKHNGECYMRHARCLADAIMRDIDA